MSIKLQGWDYSFETENGIKQEARGEMRTVNDVDVIVMRGSYSYPGRQECFYTRGLPFMTSTLRGEGGTFKSRHSKQP